MPRNLLGSQAGLPHGWVLQNGWTLTQENVPWSRGHWKLQPGDGANPLRHCSTILFNLTVLPVWQGQRMKQETSWYYHTNPWHLEYCKQNSPHMPKNYIRSGQDIKKGSKKWLKEWNDFYIKSDFKRIGLQPGKHNMVEVYKIRSSIENGVGNGCSAFYATNTQGHHMK